MNSKHSITKYIIMLTLGFLLLALDIDVNTNIDYPKEYANTDSVSGEYQYYTIFSTYGAKCTYKLLDDSADSNATYDSADSSSSYTAQSAVVIDDVFYNGIRIDILNDAVGFLLIIIACFKLKKVHRRFSLTAVCGIFGLILDCALSAFPFIINGLLLCNIAMITGFFYMLCILLTIFLFVSGLMKMCPQVCCRDERKWGQTCWFITFVLQIMVTFMFWLGSDFDMLYNLGLIFEVILAIFIVVFWRLMYRTIDYLQATYDQALGKTEELTESE